MQHDFMGWLIAGVAIGAGFTIGAGIVTGLAAPAISAILHRKNSHTP